MIDDEMNKPKGSACIRTWMEMKPTTFTLFTCLFFFLSLGSNSLNARVAEQDASKATTKTLIPLPQANPVVDANLTKQQSPPSDSTVLAETKKILPRLSQSDIEHYVILSDASPIDVTMVGTLLEATFVKYIEVCNTLGWKPRPLRHKLVAVVFREQRDYNEFAAKYDKVNKSWAVGYYSPLTDRLVFYKSESGEDVQKVVRQLDSQQRKVQQVEQSQQAAGHALRPNVDLAHVKNQLAAEHDRINDLVAGTFVSTAVHEAAHQLFFHTDVQRSGASYPLWLAEGLATNFETERTDIHFGFQVDNWRRRDSFQLACDKDMIIPLQNVLTQDHFTDETNSNEAVGFFYAQAYALTNWLLRERPTELRLYLESLRDGSFAVAQDRQKNFEAIFGPVARLERNWVRYEGRRQKEFLTSPFAKGVLAKMPTAAKTIPADTAKSDIPQPNTAPKQSSTTTLETTTQSGSQSAPVPPK